MDLAEKCRKIEERNRLRAEAAMPLLDLDAALQKLSEVEARKEYQEFARSELRARVAEKLLKRIRRKIGNPDWRPIGTLSGGGWAFNSQLEKTMDWFWQRVRNKPT